VSDQHVGAMMVVGDGIGSVRAALDLAEAGVRVHLVAPHPLLSGRMPLGEGSSPANDCELCFLGPELTLIQRHPNVEIIAGSELVGLEGEAGAFTARIVSPTGMRELPVAAVILAPAHQPYDPTPRHELGYGVFPNVVTMAEFDRIIASPGPIAWLQCVGSRDRDHNYCSSVCCLEATKKAIMAMDSHPGVQHHIFMMDMRTFGKGYLDYYNRARAQYGVQYTRCRIANILRDRETGELLLTYETETGELRHDRFQLAVLSNGMEVSPQSRSLAATLGIALNEHGFCAAQPFAQVQTSRPGVFVAGPLTQPRDTHDTVTGASAAAAHALALLAPNRPAPLPLPAYPPERDVTGEPPRVGVIFWHSRTGIQGALDVRQLAAYAATLPDVAGVESDLNGWPRPEATLAERIRDGGYNRVVMAAGSPLIYEPRWYEIMRQAGLNPYLLEIVNLREQCAWPHAGDPDAAQAKARDLLRMAVARSRRLEALPPVVSLVDPAALVIGGGVAGLNAALSLAQQGYPVTLVEREAALGGLARNIHHDLDGKDIAAYLRQLIEQVESHPLITVLLGSTVEATGGAPGAFTTRVRTPGGGLTLAHGVTIVATGGQESRGPDYGLGQHPRIMTQLDLERLIEGGDPQAQGAREVVMIQCVGPGTEYCSRVCCSVAIKHARQLKALNPAMNIYILYRDVRAYGFREQYYTQARDEGILFLRYDDDNLPQVGLEDGLTVQVRDYVLGRAIRFRPDLLVLSEGMLPAGGAAELAALLHVPRNVHGFFVEAHPKLRPVDFAPEGLFLCGVAHSPKALEEVITQAQAAAGRAARLLAQQALALNPVVAVVDQAKCTGCLTCVRICPYDVPRIDPRAVGAGAILGAAEIEAARCKGCGLCAAECPAKAIQLQHYRDEQIIAQVEAAFAPAG